MQKERQGILIERENVRKEINRTHLAFAQKINKDLKSSIDNFSISLKYQDSRYPPEFENVLKLKMGWRTSQVSKAKIISLNLSINDFIHAVIYWEEDNEDIYMSKADKKYINIIPQSLRDEYINIESKDLSERLYNKFMMVTDFISGMTDSYAKNLYQQLYAIG